MDKAEVGFFVTTGRVTAGAVEFAKRANIQIISGKALQDTYFESTQAKNSDFTYKAICLECGALVLHTLSEDKSQVTCSSGHVVESTVNFQRIAAASPKPGLRPPKCSKCGTPMRLVKGK
jgi:ssDNA-binding Zn-finger/Zn-ribbon topoisomerase 1